MADVPLPERSCTCHPDDNPPVPCPKKYALRECVTAHAAAVSAAKDERIAALEAEQRELENNVADLFAAARRHHARVQELEAAAKQAWEALEHLNNVYQGDSDLIIDTLRAIKEAQR